LRIAPYHARESVGFSFVTLGEELRAWKFLLNDRFGGTREEVDGVMRKRFREVET
jgi:hypothetical protein